MSQNIGHKMGQGISPQQFMDGMTRPEKKQEFNEWFAQFTWNEEKRRFFQTFQDRDEPRCSIIAADWCNDVIRNIPVVFKILEEAKIPTEVFIIEEHDDLINQFLTLGGKAIPVVIFTTNEGDVIDRWGPRPAYIHEPIVEFKKSNPDIHAPDYVEKKKVVTPEVRRRYGTDASYQKLVVDELYDLLKNDQLND